MVLTVQNGMDLVQNVLKELISKIINTSKIDSNKINIGKKHKKQEFLSLFKKNKNFSKIIFIKKKNKFH